MLLSAIFYALTNSVLYFGIWRVQFNFTQFSPKEKFSIGGLLPTVDVLFFSYILPNIYFQYYDIKSFILLEESKKNSKGNEYKELIFKIQLNNNRLLEIYATRKPNLKLAKQTINILQQLKSQKIRVKQPKLLYYKKWFQYIDSSKVLIK
ncbi:MAG: hypothetical protein MH321_01470 [Leptospiraceae bacterium]|nr:hypothetical protein [Leptospiraceae bacterium]